MSITEIAPSQTGQQKQTFSRIGSARAMANVAFYEATTARPRKQTLLSKLGATLEQPPFSWENPDYKRVFSEKLMEFRLRMVGALSLYSYVSNTPPETIRKDERLESFYLFWFLGASQDDVIDKLGLASKNPTVKQEIFGGEQAFHRGGLRLLETTIKDSALAPEKKHYIKGKIANWYQFLTTQESDVLASSPNSWTFEYARAYREEQNKRAGETLVAILNWDDCLSPEKQGLEDVIPQFSFLTQMIDDIADTPEDLLYKRPGYSVGALSDHPAELAAVEEYCKKTGSKKIHPKTLRKLAPESHSLLQNTFDSYSKTLSNELAILGIPSKGMLQVGQLLYRYFPTVRDIIYHISPKRAVF